MTTLAVLSDTHGLLRSEVLPYLSDVEAILHAGDVVDDRILHTLSQYAPTHAVRGNCDYSGGVSQLPTSVLLSFGEWNIYMLHDLKALDIAPQAADVQLVISGHTHTPMNEQHGGVLYLNPASCGPKRFSLPISMMRLVLPASRKDAPQVEFIKLV